MTNPKTKSWLLDLHIYGGLLLIVAGAAAVHPAFASVVLGCGLVAIGRWG